MDQSTKPIDTSKDLDPTVSIPFSIVLTSQINNITVESTMSSESDLTIGPDPKAKALVSAIETDPSVTDTVVETTGSKDSCTDSIPTTTVTVDDTPAKPIVNHDKDTTVVPGTQQVFYHATNVYGTTAAVGTKSSEQTIGCKTDQPPVSTNAVAAPPAAQASGTTKIVFQNAAPSLFMLPSPTKPSASEPSTVPPATAIPLATPKSSD